MITIVKRQRPPNFDKIAAAFPLAHRPTIVFAYGYQIFVPSGNDLTPEILAHETVHCDRQVRMGTENWWDRYLTDVNFRFFEELLAHRAELEKITEGASRQVRRSALTHISKKLSAKLYGPMVTLAQAKEALKAGP